MKNVEWRMKNVELRTQRRKPFFILHSTFFIYLFLHSDASIDSDDVVGVGEERIDVHLLYLCGKTEDGG